MAKYRMPDREVAESSGEGDLLTMRHFLIPEDDNPPF